MSFKIINAVKRGSAFMELWPADEPVLKAAFREVRVALMLRKAKWGVPPIVAIVLFMLYYSVGGIQGLRLMVTYPSAFSGYTYLYCFHNADAGKSAYRRMRIKGIVEY